MYPELPQPDVPPTAVCPAQDVVQEFLRPAAAQANHLVKMTVPKMAPKDEPPARWAGSESEQEHSQAHSARVSPRLEEAQGQLPQAELQREPQRREEPQPQV